MSVFIRLQNDAVPRPLKTVSDLQRHFLDPLDGEWNIGHGAISLKNGNRMMVVFRNTELGFVVLLQAGPRANPIGDALMSEKHDVEGVGTCWGTEMNFPRACFVDGARALTAVEHFAATGEKAPQFEWLDGDLIDTGEPP